MGDADRFPPSLSRKQAMMSAATASDHHQPSAASSARLASVTAARAAPARLRMPSPRRATLWSDPRGGAWRGRGRAARGRGGGEREADGGTFGCGVVGEGGDRIGADVDPDQVRTAPTACAARCSIRSRWWSVERSRWKRQTSTADAEPSVIESAPNATSATAPAADPAMIAVSPAITAQPTEDRTSELLRRSDYCAAPLPGWSGCRGLPRRSGAVLSQWGVI